MSFQHDSNTTRAAAARASLSPIAAALAMLVALAVVLLHAEAGNAGKASGAVVSTETSRLGRILVNGQGRTLYLFEKDRNGKSACAGQCATFWPPLIVTGKPRAAGGAKSSLLGTVRRADGRLQVTYNDHPLYRFVKDVKRGQTNGEGLDAFGAEWYVVSPAGSKIEKQGQGGYGS
jgi:predicted lipoprotein with Yx(FWY)xxD motif